MTCVTMMYQSVSKTLKGHEDWCQKPHKISFTLFKKKYDERHIVQFNSMQAELKEQLWTWKWVTKLRGQRKLLFKSIKPCNKHANGFQLKEFSLSAFYTNFSHLKKNVWSSRNFWKISIQTKTKFMVKLWHSCVASGADYQIYSYVT